MQARAQGANVTRRSLALGLTLVVGLVAGCTPDGATGPVEVGTSLALSPAPTAAPLLPSLGTTAAVPSRAEASPSSASPSVQTTHAATTAPTPSVSETPTPPDGSPADDRYAVVAGDTMSGIARRFGLPLADLIGANPEIEDPNRLAIGDRLRVPLPCPSRRERGAPSEPAWTITDLGAPYGGPAYGIRVNDRGEVLILAYDAAAMIERGFVWRDGTATDIGTLGGPSIVPWDMNDHGQVVGSSLTPSMEQHAFIWQDGVMTDLGSPGPHGADALDINERGQVVGEFVTASAHSGAFLWDAGRMIDLGNLGGDYARAEAINERGEVVGQSWTATGEMHAFLWRDGRMTDLGPVGEQGRMVAIDARGLALGNASPTGQTQQATVWDGSSATELGSLGWNVTMGHALDDRGRVVGVSLLSPTLQHAFVWREGTMTDLGLTAGSGSSAAYDIDARGLIVGEADGHAVAWQGGIMADLGTLAGFSRAEHMNDRCMATGISTTASGETHAVLWTRS